MNVDCPESTRLSLFLMKIILRVKKFRQIATNEGTLGANQGAVKIRVFLVTILQGILAFFKEFFNILTVG